MANIFEVFQQSVLSLQKKTTTTLYLQKIEQTVSGFLLNLRRAVFCLQFYRKEKTKALFGAVVPASTVEQKFSALSQIETLKSCSH